MADASRIRSLFPRPCFEQHYHRAAAAIGLARLTEGEYLVALDQPVRDFGFEYGLAVFRAQSFAMYDTHAACAAAPAVIEKLREQRACFNRRKSVQVELSLDHPVAATQLFDGLL